MTIGFTPAATINTLKARAQVLAAIRAYFLQHNVTEVDVPALGRFSVTDVHLAALAVEVGDSTQYLQTSPEFYMKRLLAAGMGDIYSLGKAYRADESGSRHRPEFTMLEWYRCGFDDAALMADIAGLLQAVGVSQTIKQVAYGEVFERITGLNPHTAGEQGDDSLAQYALQHFDAAWPNTPKSTWLDLIFSQHIEPTFLKPTLVFDFPACQCALAKIANNSAGQKVAKRFELYWQGLELANGYWELTCAQEQRARFEQDNTIRITQGLQPITPDPHFIAAMEHGLPECAGVALGIDRLLMCLLQEKDIAAVMPFAHG